MRTEQDRETIEIGRSVLAHNSAIDRINTPLNRQIRSRVKLSRPTHPGQGEHSPRTIGFERIERIRSVARGSSALLYAKYVYLWTLYLNDYSESERLPRVDAENKA